MGSSGYGNFGTYRNNGAGSSDGGGGINSEEVMCPLIIESIKLEDVGISEYYINNGSLPQVDTSIYLSPVIHDGRLVIVENVTELIIGNLPVQYNYLNICMAEGKNYTGTVAAAGSNPIPYVLVNLYA